MLTIIFLIYCYVHQMFQINNIWVLWCGGATILLQICCFYNPRMILLVFCHITILGDDVIGYISHPNALSSWILGFLPYHEKWGEIFLNHCVFWIYGPLLMSLLNSTIFFVLIFIKNSFSYHILYDSVVCFILSINPRYIATSSFHGYFYFVKKEVCDIYLVC